MVTLSDKQRKTVDMLLDMLETKPEGRIKYERKYDNYGNYISTLGMFEFYCKKKDYDKALYELEETIFLYFPVGDRVSYNMIRESIKENLGV